MYEVHTVLVEVGKKMPERFKVEGGIPVAVTLSLTKMVQ